MSLGYPTLALNAGINCECKVVMDREPVQKIEMLWHILTNTLNYSR